MEALERHLRNKSHIETIIGKQHGSTAQLERYLCAFYFQNNLSKIGLWPPRSGFVVIISLAIHVQFFAMKRSKHHAEAGRGLLWLIDTTPWEEQPIRFLDI